MFGLEATRSCITLLRRTIRLKAKLPLHNVKHIEHPNTSFIRTSILPPLPLLNRPPLINEPSPTHRARLQDQEPILIGDAIRVALPHQIREDRREIVGQRLRHDAQCLSAG